MQVENKRNIESTNVRLNGVSGAIMVVGKLSAAIEFEKGVVVQNLFYVVHDFECKVDGILGLDFLNKMRVKLDFSKHAISFEYNYVEREYEMEGEVNYISVPARCEKVFLFETAVSGDCIILPYEVCKGVFVGGMIVCPSEKKVPVRIMNVNENNAVLKNFAPIICKLDEYNAVKLGSADNKSGNRVRQLFKEVKLDHLNVEERKEVMNIIVKYADVFHLPEDKLGTCNVYKQGLEIKPGTVPAYTKPYRVPFEQREEVKRQINKMIEDDIVEPAASPWSAPILIVPKKSNQGEPKKWRLVIDYRKVNLNIVDDKFPLPNITDIFDSLAGAIYFSHLDLAQGYYQLELDEESRKMTAFSTSEGQFQMKRLPMGLKISPSAFSRAMSIAMSGLTFVKCFIYLDDLIVYGKNLSQHNNNLIDIMDRLRKVNLKLNGGKCQFLKKELLYLGHIIKDGGILPDPEKVQAIANCNEPTNCEEVKRVVALTNYYRRHLRDFAHIATPLNKLTRKNAIFEWSQECQDAFRKIKESITTAPLLEFPNFEKDNKFRVTTDASGYAIGAILSNSNGKPVCFASRALNKSELNYATIEKELLAVVWAVKHFRPYLFGRKFEIFTDHKPLEGLFKMKNPSSRLTKFRLLLEEYDFEVVYVKGKNNAGADFLSRLKVNKETVHMVTRAKQHIPNTIEILKRRGSLIYITRDEKHVWKLPKINEAVYHREKDNTFIIVPWAGLDIDSTVSGLMSVFRKNQIKELTITSDQNCENSVNQFSRKFKQYDHFINIYILKGVEPVMEADKKALIMNNFHLTSSGGHAGVNKMLVNIKRRYTWSGIAESVRKFVNNCDACQRTKIVRHNRHELIKTTTAQQAFEKIYLDLVGPLPLDNQSNKYILTIQCEVTKWVENYPLKNKTSEAVAEAFGKEFVLRYGPPRVVATDKGKEFVSALFRDVCGVLGIDHRTATPYHHESIGALENTHKHLNNYLTIKTNEKKRDWSDWLPYWSFSYNNSVHLSTGYTPHELVFGRRCNMPESKGEYKTVKNYGKYPEELKERLKVAMEEARKNLDIAKNKIINNYKCSKIEEYKVGDKIYLRNMNRKNKLEYKYIGPFDIEAINIPNVDIRMGSVIKTVHINNTKKKL